MGKTLKVIVCGKKETGKTSILEQLVYNNLNTNLTSSTSSSSSSSTSNGSKYLRTIEDIYIACWEKDKGVKEKLRLYDTRGLESSKDQETIQQMRHLYPLVDGAVLVFSSLDPDSIQCVERLKQEIEKSKDKKEVCHFVLIDNQSINNNLDSQQQQQPPATPGSREILRQELQTRLRCPVYELVTLEKRDLLCRPFVDLAINITQVNAKSSMNIVQSIKKPKVFSSK